ncbi:MAG: FAD-dependent oxidoreductase [Desulfobacteraceae bacterium 4484_190.3]|nr:MAG: FAD-dependent oxidoreductase [Desulfobacteraceae bacterium 4484_190.3]
MAERRIIVVGGGAAGLMAAGRAAEAGINTLLLEKMDRPGRKLCTTERGGRVFPASGKASDVLSVLLQWLERCNVQINHSSPVEKLVINGGHITGAVSRGRAFPCDSVILATGGASYPGTGSTGDGYLLAVSAGHNIVPQRPALVPLETAGGVTGKMAGLNLRNTKVRMFVNGRKHKEAFGEVVFTEFGVTGPVILTLSGEAVDAIRAGHKITISIDLKPALDDKKLDARLLRDFTTRGKEQVNSLLRGLLPREMVPVCLELIGIPPERSVSSISAKERRRLRMWLKDFRLEVTGYRPFTEAIITAGGVDTREIDPRTMESRKTKGLFIVGELLDIHADTGGYNLQAAFSTGWLAGSSAAPRE